MKNQGPYHIHILGERTLVIFFNLERWKTPGSFGTFENCIVGHLQSLSTVKLILSITLYLFEQVSPGN